MQIIVGAGETGLSAALALREGGWKDQILLIGAEEHLPYERPPLSKEVLVKVGSTLPSCARARGLKEAGIDYLAGININSINRDAHTVQTHHGQTLHYERLLLAMGSSARALNCSGGHLARVLRTYADAAAIKARLHERKHVLIIGAGFIGLEVAASARSIGCAVTILEYGSRILQRGVPEIIATLIARKHVAEGVDLRCNTGVLSIENSGTQMIVSLADGSKIFADLVIAGVGATPNTQLAAAAGLPVNNGIVVDATLATSDADIFAAGDCCSFPHPIYDGRRIRVEAWRNAQVQGAFAARAMLGVTEHFSTVPWFWSDQYDMHLQIVGLVDEGIQTVMRPVGEDGRLTFHLDKSGRLVAAAGVGPMGKIAKDIRLAEMLIMKRAKPEVASLTSPDSNLKKLVTA